MSDFQTVAKVGEIPQGEGRAFAVDGTMVGVFNVNGQYLAINDTCPHMGASLATGDVDGETVMCPWHAWQFCLKDGLWLDNPKSEMRTGSYPVRVVGGDIQVQLPDAPDRSSYSAEPETG